jgi:hypothetical protein
MQAKWQILSGAQGCAQKRELSMHVKYPALLFNFAKIDRRFVVDLTIKIYHKIPLLGLYSLHVEERWNDGRSYFNRRSAGRRSTKKKYVYK